MKKCFSKYYKITAFNFLLVLFSQNILAGNCQARPSIGSIELSVDTSKTLSFEEVVNSSTFEPVANGHSNHKAYNYWFRIKIMTNGTKEKNYFLSLYSGDHFDLTCYCFFKDSLVVQQAGFFHKKELNTSNPNPSFNIYIPDTNEFYLYVKTNTAGSIENYMFELQSPEEFYKSQGQRQFTFGVFYGILIILILINTFYFFSLRRKAFFYYAVYVSIAFFLFSYVDGIPLLGLMNGIGENHRFFLLTAMVLQFAFVPFMAIHYVQLEKINKKLMKICTWFLVFMIFTLVITFLFPSDRMYEFQFLFHNFTILICIFLSIITGIKGIKINKTLGWSYLIAHFILSASVIISLSESLGFTDLNLYYDVIKLGFLLEGIILSFALALYFRHLDLNLTEKSKALNVLTVDYDETKRKFLNLEGSFLRSQMNPHFIFNSLNSIQSYILANNTILAARYLTSFSRLMRLILENSRESEILLANEISALNHYLDLEKMRFKNLFNYFITIDKDIDKNVVLIPPMLVQPYVENAILHGIMNKGGEGKIEIDFKLHNGLIRCTVTDNGVGRKAAQSLKNNKEAYHRSAATGITTERLKQLNNYLKGKISVDIKDIEDEQGNPTGTQVEIFIPYSSNN